MLLVVLLAVPSPKLQRVDVAVTEDVFITWIASPAHTLSGAVNEVVMLLKLNRFSLLIVSRQPLLLMVIKLTEYVPGVVYVWEGFCCVEVLPSPKFHW